jgi:outer membrane protein assembly factor BamB
VRRPALLSLLLLACSDRPPPAGSGSLETTPTGSAPRPPELAPAASAITYPNGSVSTLDPARCSVRLLRDGTVKWARTLAGCDGFLSANVAMDSTLYVRDPHTLSAFDADGTLKWAKKLEGAPPLSQLATPAVLADSRAALATTSRGVTVFERDGTIAWSFSLPSGEDLVSPPAGMRTEGMILITERATYYLGATGEVRWRVDGAAKP